ncbi:MAG: autotransporter-associated beta strand repeat-containing protein [Opitutaceae bacterium]
MFLAPGLSHADAVFDFPNAHPLLGEGIDNGTDGRMTVTDLAVITSATLSTVEIVGQDGSLASTGTLNVMGSGNNAIGVESVNNVNGNTNNDRDFDPGEKWVFKFDVDVELVYIDFAGWNDTESEFTLSFSDATSDIVLSGDESDDIFSLSNTLITAGVEITFEVTNATGDNQVRLQEFSVSAIPPPPTGNNLIWAGSDGDAWNEIDANFSGDDTVFVSGDNVEIQTAGAINVDAGGITAGSLTDTTPTGTVTLQTGDLTGTSLTKSGAGTLLIDSPITLDTTIATVLSGGTLQVANGGTLSTDAISFSGGSTLQLDAGAVLTIGSTILLGSGGVTIDTEEAISLDDVSNSTVDVPLIKQGSAVLTLTGELGAQSSGPVDLDILGGSIVATGANQLNIGGNNVWNGDLTLNLADLEFHGSTVSGTGSIISQSGSASINSRFDRGEVNIANGIVLNSDLLVDAPTNGGSSSELYLKGVISGAANLEKGGNGLVVLTADNTYAGTTTINGNGTLQVGGGLTSTSGSLGAGSVTIDAGSIEFSRNDAVVVSNTISGTGNVIINNGASGSTELSTANDYTGVTRIDGGTLIASEISNGGFTSSVGAATVDAANIVLRGQAILSYTGAPAVTNRAFSLGGLVNGSVTGGGTISADGSGPIEFNSTADVGADGTGVAERVLTLSGSAPGISSIALRITDGQASTHSVVKDGTTSWLLTGINTYTGDTIINNGTLQLGASTDLTNTSIVRINGATSILQLTDGVTDVIEELWIDGVQMDAGLYGSSTSSAPVENQDDDHFIGTGVLSVTSGPVSANYDTWATANGIDGELAADDFDFDGISNLMEYALGTDPTVSTQPAGVYSGNTVTYTKGLDAIANGDVSWTIEISELLTPGSWTDEVIQAAGDASATIEYTFTPGSPDKEFARLKVIQE